MKKPNRRNKIIIGLTGGIASGKKTAAKILQNFGALVINADEVYKDLTKRRGRSRPSPALNLKIAKTFGKNVLNKDLSLNKKALAEIVFNVGARRAVPLQRLNKITHPAIIKEIKKRIKAAKSNVIVLVAPLLIEAKQTFLVDEVWLIACSRKTQIERVMKRDRVSRKEALVRISSQMNLKQKTKFADFVIRNNKTKKELAKQIKNKARYLNERSEL